MVKNGKKNKKTMKTRARANFVNQSQSLEHVNC
jgi:hypothetical protein